MRGFLYCLIFPHPSNNHRAGFLHHRILASVIGLLIFSSLFFSLDFNPLSEKIKAFADISTQELLDLTNENRIEKGLSPLISNTQLNIAAEKKAEDMFAKNYWAHNSPDGTTPWVFITEAGYNYVYAGENLARGFNNAEDIVSAWMASTAGHRENILSPKYEDIGFAVKSGSLNGEETFVVVQEFGSKSILPQVQDSEASTEEVKKAESFILPTEITKPQFSFSGTFIIILISMFILVMLIDLVVTKRRKIVRFVGHNIDHVLFLIIILIVIEIISNGVIL